MMSVSQDQLGGMMLQTITKLKSKWLKDDGLEYETYQEQYFNAKFNSSGSIAIELSGSIIVKDI